MSNESTPPALVFIPGDRVQPPFEAVVPATQSLPGWFSNLPVKSDEIKAVRHKTVKMCMPFNDALGIGWMVKSPSKKTDFPAITSEFESSGQQIGNSLFATPDCVIDTGFDIELPEDYSLIVVPPINRFESRFTPFSLKIPAGTTTRLRIPIRTTGGTPSFNPGDELAQLIPIRDDQSLSQPRVRSYQSDDPLADIVHAVGEATTNRSAAYRREFWQTKMSMQVFKNEAELRQKGTVPIPVDVDTPSDRELLPEGEDQAYYVKDQYLGEALEPCSGEQLFPEEISNALFDSEFSDHHNDLADWIMGAVRHGTVIPGGTELHVSRNSEGMVSADAVDSNSYHTLHPGKTGDLHPFGRMQPINTMSKWMPILRSGFSNLYIRPLNHFQQHFKSFTGVVDSDGYASTVNIPGRIVQDINQVTLHRDMALTQAIPIHRESMLTNAVIDDG